MPRTYASLTLEVAEAGTNPGRTANKAGEHLRAVLSWAWEQGGPPTHPFV
jgi:hypothetical protein